MSVIEAKVMDPTHLELSRPLDADLGARIFVVVSESPQAEASTEQHEWLEVSTDGLRAAYGEEEPDYPSTMIKEDNPDYGS